MHISLNLGGLGFLQNDVDLIHEIEAVIGKQLEEFECKEKDVLSDITRVRKDLCVIQHWSLVFMAFQICSSIETFAGLQGQTSRNDEVNGRRIRRESERTEKTEIQNTSRKRITEEKE